MQHGLRFRGGAPRRAARAERSGNPIFRSASAGKQSRPRTVSPHIKKHLTTGSQKEKGEKAKRCFFSFFCALKFHSAILFFMISRPPFLDPKTRFFFSDHLKICVFASFKYPEICTFCLFQYPEMCVILYFHHPKICIIVLTRRKEYVKIDVAVKKRRAPPC